METLGSVLVIDDENGIVESIRKILRKENMDVQTAPHGEDALSMIHAGYQPHLIICDLTMPHMNGIDFVRKANEYEVTAPIAILSAHAEPEKMDECKKLGVAEYIVKPIEAKLFVEKVRNLVKLGQERVKNN